MGRSNGAGKAQQKAKSEAATPNGSAGSLAAFLDTVDDRLVQPVKVREWGRTVYLRSLTVAERVEMEREVAALGEDATNAKIMATGLTWMLSDAEGNRELGSEHAAKLEARNFGVLYRLFREGNALNGLQAEDLEAEQGNSEATFGDGSASS